MKLSPAQTSQRSSVRQGYPKLFLSPLLSSAWLNLCILLIAFITGTAFALPGLEPTQSNIPYGTADGQTLTMDYYAASGPGTHPIAIIIHGGGYTGGTSRNGSEAYCADFLAPAGYTVFSINYRLAPKYPYPYMVEDVERAIRFIRFHAAEWNGDPHRIALVGGSAGGFLSNMVGLLRAPGDPLATDPVDRESAAVQAVVTLFAQSSFAIVPLNGSTHALLDPLIAKKGRDQALREASPITYVSKSAPPFLQIIGDKDEFIPLSEVENLDQALRAVGASSQVIVIHGAPHATGSWYRVPGVPDWERQMTEWLNRNLDHSGPIGKGIRAREPGAAPPVPPPAASTTTPRG